MKVDGLRGPIRGTAFDGWFAIDSFQWGSGKGVSSVRRPKKKKKPAAAEGSTAEDDQKKAEPEPDRTCSSPSYSEATISMAMDGFSAVFLHGMPVHTCYNPVTIEAITIDGYVSNRWFVGAIRLAFPLEWMSTNCLLTISALNTILRVFFETLFSGFSTSGSDSWDNASQSVSLNFTRMEWMSASWRRRPCTSREKAKIFVEANSRYLVVPASEN